MTDRLSDIIKHRREKLEKITRAGINAYPSAVTRTHTGAEAQRDFKKLSGKKIALVGRIRSLRTMGKIIFAEIEDGTGRIQVLFKQDNLGQKTFSFIKETLDIGDFIECGGKLFLTKTKEKTLEIKTYKLLAKSLLPLPGEYYGLEDVELRLRKRYLDILTNPEARDLFIRKNKFWTSMRRYLTDADFLELEMPILESVPGGAEAEPFTTHHNALDREFYLRISLELPLKKMLVAGYEKVFEIGRIFRNEDISTEHLQDYTQMEFYWAYADFDQLMKFSEQMYKQIIKDAFGTLKLPYQGQVVDWGKSWPRQDYSKLFKRYTSLDLAKVTEADLRTYCHKHKLEYETGAGKGRLIDIIFKRQIRVKPEVALQPSFLINPPVEIEPLAKRDPKNLSQVQRFQILACMTELGKGFGELNDPIDQRERFEAQMALREKGDKEAQMIDEDYIEAMEYGMPPAAGFGLSERLFAVLSDLSVRETQIFPLMKEQAKDSKKKAK